MSTESRQTDENQNVNQSSSQHDLDHPILPARSDEPLPTNGDELSKDEWLRLEQLAEQANLSHNLAKDAALQFCKHSIEAGIALLEAHDLCPKGTWFAWLAEHFDGSIRTAQRYMQQANCVLPIGGDTTDLSRHHPEELTRLFSSALKRLERQRAAAAVHSESSAAVVAAEGITEAVDVVNDNPPSNISNGDPLTRVVALFDELLAALRLAIDSGQWLDYGEFVLDEMERIRGDVDVCRLLIRDAHLGSPAPI